MLVVGSVEEGVCGGGGGGQLGVGGGRECLGEGFAVSEEARAARGETRLD